VRLEWLTAARSMAPSNWQQFVWIVAREFGFSPDDVLSMDFETLYFWAEGVRWLSERAQSSYPDRRTR
jgi:hypothetical protein